MSRLTIDEIAFGNPCSRDYKLMQKESFLDKLLPSLQRFTPPKNSSRTTQSELHLLLNYVNAKRAMKNNLYDQELLDHIKQLFVDAGADYDFITEIANSIADDVVPLVTKLKYKFNRPRPSQLAHYYRLNLFPDFSYFTNNPSYPSGHVTLTAVTTNVLGNLYPEAYKKVLPLIEEVKQSRLYLGVHYPSDNDMAMVVAKAIIEHPEFKINYHI